jgi:hypothetical protein
MKLGPEGSCRTTAPVAECSDARAQVGKAIRALREILLAQLPEQPIYLVYQVDLP